MRGQQLNDIPEVYSEVVRVVKNKPEKYDETKRVLICDFDSVLHTSCYFPPDSLTQFPTEELQLEEAKFRVRNKLQEIQNNVEEHFKIVKTLLFVGGKNNFRYLVYKDYKKNRSLLPINPLIKPLKEYAINELEALEAHNGEADDYCIETIKISQGNCVIAALDKDILMQAPNVPIYNYRSYKDTIGEFKYMTEKECRLAFANSVVCGDATDGINFCKNRGVAWCKKNLHQDMTNYQFIKTIFKCYIDVYKSDTKSAKENLKLCYLLLKLHTQEEIKKINLKYSEKFSIL